MTDIAVVELTRDQAVRLTQRIREAAEETWVLLLEAHEGRAWNVMGYDSWRQYATTEFGMGQSTAYQLLDQAKVVRAIEEATGVSAMAEISERDARRIKPILPEVLDELRERTDGLDSEQVAEVLKKVVGEIKDRQADELAEKRARFADHVEKNPFPPFVPTQRCPVCAGSGRIPQEST